MKLSCTYSFYVQDRSLIITQSLYFKEFKLRFEKLVLLKSIKSPWILNPSLPIFTTLTTRGNRAKGKGVCTSILIKKVCCDRGRKRGAYINFRMFLMIATLNFSATLKMFFHAHIPTEKYSKIRAGKYYDTSIFMCKHNKYF